MPDGRPTKFGTGLRNLAAEEDAMNAGLAPGQVRAGLGLLLEAIRTFERFVEDLGHRTYFVEPLFYHNAFLFEKYGFNYQTGRRMMHSIDEGFQTGGRLLTGLDNSTPFRMRGMEHTIRSRSWAIHDGLLGENFTDVIMYKDIGRSAGVETSPGVPY
jgi:hypothetical protein